MQQQLQWQEQQRQQVEDEYVMLSEAHYPRLASEFFRQLRHELPTAFRRHSNKQLIARGREPAARSSSSSSSDRSLVNQTNIADLDERLKLNCTNFRLLREQQNQLVLQLRLLQESVLLSLHVAYAEPSTAWKLADLLGSSNAAAAVAETEFVFASRSCLDDVLSRVTESSEADYKAVVMLVGREAEVIVVDKQTIVSGQDDCMSDTSQQSTVSDFGKNTTSCSGITTLLTTDLNAANNTLPECGNTTELQIKDSRPECGSTVMHEDIAPSIDTVMHCVEHSLSSETECVEAHLPCGKPPLASPAGARQHVDPDQTLELRQSDSRQTDVQFSSTVNHRAKFKLPWRKHRDFFRPQDELEQWQINFDRWKSQQGTTDSTLKRIFNVEPPESSACSGVMMQSDSEQATDSLSDDIIDCSLNDCIESFATTTLYSGNNIEQQQELVQLQQRRHSDDLSTSRHGQHSIGRRSLRQHISNLKNSASKQLTRFRKAVSLQRLNHISDGSHTNYTPDVSRTTTTNTNCTASQYSAQDDYTSEDTFVDGSQQHSDMDHTSDSIQQHVNHTREKKPCDGDSMLSWRSSTSIDSPRHFRPIGRVLSYSSANGVTDSAIELIKPPHGPFGFYISKDLRGGTVVSRLCDGLPRHFWTGLLDIGDEITNINGDAIADLSLDHINDIIAQSACLVLTLRRFVAGSYQ